MVTPAEGPSLGMDPSGEVDVEVVLREDLAVDAELPRGPGVAQGGLADSS